MKRKLMALLLASLMLLSLAAACGNSDNPDTSDPNGGNVTDPNGGAADPNGGNDDNSGSAAEKVYRTYMSQDADTLNGQNTVQSANATPLQWCSATLFRDVPDEDGQGFHYIPDLAAEMPIKIDDNTWQVKLRQEAKWQNGDPINADTFMYSYKTLLDPLDVKAMANFLANGDITIVNAEDYYMQGSSNTVAWEDVGIKKIDEYTLEFKTVEPVDEQAFCTHFMVRALYPIHQGLYESNMAADGTVSAYGSTLDTWVGCGPYKFVQWEYDSIQVYEKNPDYWLSDMFHWDRVEVRIVPEMNARVEMWESGQIDELAPDANTLETYIDDPRLISYPDTMVYHYDINCKNENNPITASVNYRKALYHAINREVIAQEIYGHQQPTGTYVNGQAGILSTSGQTYRESKYGKEVTDMIEEWGPYGYNPEMALEYLDKAYEECNVSKDTVITLKYLYGDGSAEDKKVCEFLMEEFPKIFEGRIQVESQVIAPGMALDYMVSNINDWDIVMMDWDRWLSRTVPYQCYYYFTEGYSAHPNNYFGPNFEAAWAEAEAARSADYETVLQNTQKVELAHLEDMVNIPFCQVVNYIMFSDRLDLPVNTYIPGFGWGTMYADLAE